MSCINLLDAVKKRVCDRCKSSFITPHASLGNYYKCQNCNRIGYAEDFPRATLFHRLTESPEVLAAESVYAHENCRIPDGATSPFIDNIFWFDDEEGSTWDERFDSAWEKAKNATLEKLKEVEKC